jgi:hypothetical protein
LAFWNKENLEKFKDKIPESDYRTILKILGIQKSFTNFL